jgi:uncharacterized alpha-E superfamily protein
MALGRGHAGAAGAYQAKFGSDYTASTVVNFILRDRDNPGNVLSMVEQARHNARMVRTGITREVWEAVNESWMILKEELARTVPKRGWAACSTSSAASPRWCAGRWKARCCATTSTISPAPAASSNGPTTPRAFST